MPNSFSKEERTAFEDILEGFHDALVMSSLVTKYNTDDAEMERSSDITWRPMPYIAQSHDGSDATSNFNDSTQLAVPATIGYQKHSTSLLTAKQLLDDNPNPSKDEIQDALAGNLCRCTGYTKIVEAVADAAAEMRGEKQVA